MGKITVNRREVIQNTDTNINKDNGDRIIYTPCDFAYLQTDYLGNIFLKYHDKYYFVGLDSALDQGVELSPVIHPETFKKNLLEMQSIVSNVKSGEIRSGNQTLRGRVYESLNEMTEDEREEYLIKNDGSIYDPQFKERDYFWVQYKQDDELLEDELDDTYFINGYHSHDVGNYGIYYSELLCLTPGSFDTILINGDLTSKNVVSNVERIDGYCTCRLTVHESGHMRTNFIDMSKLGILCIDDTTSELVIEKFN